MNHPNLVAKTSAVQKIWLKQSYLINEPSPELEDSKPIFLHDTLAHDVVSPYQVSLQTVSSWGYIIQMNIHYNSEPFPWPWPWPQQSNPIFSQDNLPYDNVPSNQVFFVLFLSISRADILKRHILIILSTTVTLNLKTANQSVSKPIWLIMMHHHTTFGSKRFSVSEDTIWTNIHLHFEILLWPWPWTWQSNFSIKHSGLW